MNFNELFSEHGLSLDRLRSFLEVVDAGGIAAATRSDANRQSLYSRQIKELETFFGTALTKRKGRRLEITSEGERLARLVRSTFTELADFRADSKNETRRAIIAGGASLIEWLVSPTLSDCRQALGHPLIETRSLRSADICRAIDNEQIDFGILRREAIPANLKSVNLGKLTYALYIPKKLAPPRSPKTDKQWSKLLSTLPQARLIPGSRFRRAVEEAHQALLIRPNIIAETSSILQLAALVKTGQAAAILPKTAQTAFTHQAIKEIPLTGFLDHQRELSLAYSKSHLTRRNWTSTHLKALKITLQNQLS